MMDRRRLTAPSRISRMSRKSTYHDEDMEHLIVVPPDGGWGWCIVVAVFFCNLIADGISYSFGLFLSSLAESFNVTIGQVTIIGSLMSCFYYLAGPVVSALVNRFGFRFVSILGSLTAVLAYAGASFCPNFEEFIFLAGVVSGIGLGMITITSIITVGYYFEKWRAMAIGIATCGSGIGTLSLPPLINLLLDNLGWRNTYRVLAGLLLLAGIAGTLFRPLKPIKVRQDEKEIKTVNVAESAPDLDYSAAKTCCKCPCKFTIHDVYYPTTADILQHPTVIVEEMPDALSDDDSSDESFVTYVTGARSGTSVKTTATLRQEQKCRMCCRRCRHCAGCQTSSRPMYRDDIFFAHTMKLLPKYKESLSPTKLGKQRNFKMAQPLSKMPVVTGYHLSVTRVTTFREMRHDPRKCKCSLTMLRTLSTMLDFNLLRSPAFQLFAWSGAFIVFGYMVPFLYIVDRAVKAGCDEDIAFWLISAIGAANTVGRIISGILPSVVHLPVIEYSIAWLFISGVITAGSGFLMSIEFQFIYAGIYGFAGSCIVTLRPIIIVDLFGLENLTNAYGLQLLFMGISAFVGTMAAGFLYDFTQEYDYSFYMAGGCLVFSAFLLCFIRIAHKRESFGEVGIL